MHQHHHRRHCPGSVRIGRLWAAQRGEDRRRLVADLRQHELGDIALGPRATADDGSVGAAHVQHGHGLGLGDGTADPPGAAGQALGVGVEGCDDHVGRHRAAALAAADGHALVAERRPRHGPAAVDRPDHVVVGDEDVVEEDLVEVRVPGDLLERAHLHPFACMSMTMVVMPWCLGTSGSVRMVASPKLAYWAPLVHTFWPLTSQPPSTRVPLVLTPAASLPASGSLNSWHQMTS